MSTNKKSKKKHTVRVYKQSHDAAPISITKYEPLNFSLNDTEPVSSLVLSLSKCEESADQVKTVQKMKGTIKSAVAEWTGDSKQAYKDVYLLCDLYLNPKCLTLRRSLDWIPELILRYPSLTQTELSKCVAEVCLAYMREAQRMGGFQAVSLNEMLEWIFALNCMAAMDRDVTWLNDAHWTEEEGYSSDVWPASENIGEGLIVEFFQILNSIFGRCSEYVESVSNADNSNSAEIIRYAEGCGECMRAVMTVLKYRRVALIVDASPTWEVLLASFITRGYAVLACPLVNKDILTAVSLALMSLQWLGRTSGVAASLTSTFRPQITGMQVVALMNLLRIENTSNAPARAQTIVRTNSASHEVLHKFALEVGVHEAMVKATELLPLLAKAALFRAMLSVYDDNSYAFVPSLVRASNDIELNLLQISSQLLADLGTMVDKGDAIANNLLLNYAYEMTLSMCNHYLPQVRLYGLQTLETWLGRIESIFAYMDNVNSHALLQCVIEKLAGVSLMLTKTWSHPSKLVNHMVPVVYERLLNVVQSVESRVSPNDNIFKHDEADAWDIFISHALMQPVQHRGRYQSLSLLLPKVGGHRFLHVNPNIIQTLILSVRIRDIASSASTLFGNFLKSFKDIMPMSSIRELWMTDIALCLCSPEYKLRINVADYLVSEVLTFDSDCAIPFINRIRTVTGPDYVLTVEQRLWGMINVVLQARLMTLPGRDIIENEYTTCEENMEVASSGPLREYELTWACTSNDVDLRLAGLTVLTASKQTVAPIPPVELSILKATLHYSLKSPLADHRHRVLRVFRILVTRLRETYRLNSKDLKKSRSHPLEKREPQLEEQYALRMDDVFNTCKWLSALLLSNLYPGAPFEREVMALELMHCVVDGIRGTTNTAPGEHISSEYDSTLLVCFFQVPVVHTMLNLLISSWDRTRVLAAEFLLKMPWPLPGYDITTDGTKTVNLLLTWGFRLASSPRQRESDAGALIIRVVMVIYCLHLGQDVISATEDIVGLVRICSDDSAKVLLPTPQSTAAFCMVERICSMLDGRLVTLQKIFDSIYNPSEATMSTEASNADNIPLCHGLVVALNHCLDECYKVNIFYGEDKTSRTIHPVWKKEIQRVLAMATQALQVAMSVVADANSDAYFAPIPNENSSGFAKGPVNANTYMCINTNGYMDSSDVGQENDESSGLMVQRAVVAAWLLVKESCALLTKLVNISPTPSENTSDLELLSEKDIQSVGEMILDGLGRLKHMGAISEAQSALQGVCEYLIRQGDRNSNLCKLPSMWLNKLLARVEGEQQSFILRRSAGFAYSFLSLLKAEPGNCQSSLLPQALTSLMKFIKSGVDDADTTVSWKTCVHSLNILRLILLDAALGPEADAYIPQAVMYAVRGFKSELWAVRNSCMMVFSAIVQRAVDNDKKECGGAKAATAMEFFQRYPSLFPFLLNELATILKFDVQSDADSWPTGVSPMNAGQPEVANTTLPPTLFPILLLLSKLRAATVGTAPTMAEIGNSDLDESKLEVGSNFVGKTPLVNLFVPLVESCADQRLHQVRAVASRALAALVPLQEVPHKCASILKWLLLNKPSSSTLIGLDSNEIHAYLFFVQEMLHSLLRNMEGGKMQLGENNLFFSGIIESLAGIVFDLLDQLRRCFLPNPATTSYKAQYSPAIIVVFLEIVKFMNTIVSSPQTHLLLAVTAQGCVYDVMHHQDESLLLPCEPLLIRNALYSLSYLIIQEGIEQTIPVDQLKLLSYASLMKLYDHPMSEVRDGILSGSCDALAEVNGAASYILSGSTLSFLLRRCLQEREPPLLKKTMKYLCRLSECVSFRSIPEATQRLFIDSIDVFLHHVGNTYTPSSMLESAATSDEAATEDLGLMLPSKIEIAPTATAAYSLQMIGWIMHYFFGELGNVLDYYDSTTLKSNDDSGIYNAYIWQWLRCVEDASHESSNVDTRHAAAKSLILSNVLTWCTCNSVTAIGLDRPLQHEMNNGTINLDRVRDDRAGGDFACRMWAVALRLLQDDDSDVRAESTSSVSESIAYMLSLAPCMSRLHLTPLIPLPLLEHMKDIAHSSVMLSAGTVASMAPGLILESVCLPYAACLIWSCVQGNVYVSSDRKAVSKSQDEEDEVVHTTSGLHCVLHQWREACGITATNELDVADMQGDAASQRIFEAESSNLHAETMVTCGVLTSTLCLTVRLLPPALSGMVWKPLVTGGQIGVATMRDMVHWTKTDWIGGPFYNPDIYAKVSCAMLGVSMLSDTETYSQEMYETHAALLELRRQIEDLRHKGNDANAFQEMIHPVVAGSLEAVCELKIEG